MAAKAWPVAVGVFEDRNQADSAVLELKRAGFDDDDIGYVIRTPDGGHVVEPPKKLGGEGFAAGAVIGGIAGAAAAVMVPGIGPVLAGGTLLGILGGAAVGGAAGGILGALAAMGIPEEEATFYEGEFQAGRILVTVKAGERFDEASAILHRFAGYDVRRGAPARTATA
ncbi:MAG TPA: hypothetical protein VG370_21815 [Chloroflexota bacterium]|jgi:hypothetical protein|nr:hypothetical protein [Chloroflexota bacterium]